MGKKRIFKSADCDRGLLTGRKIAVVGYGSQGRAWGLNLKDSGCEVSIILRAGSSHESAARNDGLEVARPETIGSADIAVFAFPDHEQPEFYRTWLRQDSGNSKLIVFLAGLNVHFGNIVLADNHDSVLVAPHGPGDDLREKYVSGEGLSCFFAVDKNPSGAAQDVGLALADALGCGKPGIFETTFKDEAVGDLFGEQALLVGGLAGMTMAAFDKLVEQGLEPENAYLETVAQLRLLTAMVEKHGPVGMMERVSQTARSGALMAMLLLFNEDFDKRLHQVYEFVASGEFNKFLRNEAAAGFAKTDEIMAMLSNDECQKTVDRIRSERDSS